MLLTGILPKTNADVLLAIKDPSLELSLRGTQQFIFGKVSLFRRPKLPEIFGFNCSES